MKTSKRISALLIAGLMLPTSIPVTAAAETFIYPAKGQSAEQQASDKAECSTWATQQTGFDPAAPPPPSAPPPPPPAPTGGLVRGGARGAAVGAIGGAIGGDAGKGAAIGAATGALLGGIRRRDQIHSQEYEQQQWAQQQAAQLQAKQATWQKAYDTCLTGRGYTVSS